MRRMKAAELLPPEILEKLSRDGRRLYRNLWNRMARLGIPEIRQRNSNVTYYARLSLAGLTAAQHELVEADLMEIYFDEYPDLLTDNKLVRYVFPAKHQQAED